MGRTDSDWNLLDLDPDDLYKEHAGGGDIVV
jgi:hypothetical protein